MGHIYNNCIGDVWVTYWCVISLIVCVYVYCMLCWGVFAMFFCGMCVDMVGCYVWVNHVFEVIECFIDVVYVWGLFGVT